MAEEMAKGKDGTNASEAAPKSLAYLTKSQKLYDSKDDPGGKIEETTYIFKELGKALPELENEVIMGPRYMLRDDRFIIFLNREKQEYDGMSSSEDQDEEFYHLTVELPAVPVSETGKVEGSTVSWRFTGEQLKKLRSASVGTPILEASIPASAINADLKPRLVSEKKDNVFGRQRKDKSPLESFRATLPVLDRIGWKPDDKNADLDVLMPLGKVVIPFPYENLSLARLVVDGKSITAKLNSNPSGVFNGKGPWGNPAAGLPVKLKFSLSDPWVKNIDLVEVRLNISAPKKTRELSVRIESLDKPLPVLTSDQDKSLKVAIADIKLGSSTATLPGPSIDVLSSIEPSTFLTVYLDTPYGLRYPPVGLQWEKETIDDLYDKDAKAAATKAFGKNASFYSGDLSYKTIPNPPFTLVFVIITEKSMVPHTLKLEDISISHE